jgi:hypothetical protein
MVRDEAQDFAPLAGAAAHSTTRSRRCGIGPDHALREVPQEWLVELNRPAYP